MTDTHSSSPDSIKTGAPVIEILAKHLWDSMERLDPSGGCSWEMLSPGERAYYRECIIALLKRGDDLKLALQLADNGNVFRHFESRPDSTGAGEPGEEVTPEMVSAGLAAYWDYDSRVEGPEDAVREIYLAMRRAKTRA